MRKLLLLALLLAAPLPLAAQVRRPLPPPTQIASTLPPVAERAPIGYESIQGRVLFRARIGGREVWALLDNGAERSLIDLNLATALGLKFDSSPGIVRGAGGTLTARRVLDVPVSIAGQFEARLPMVGVDMAPASGILQRRIEFVLGADLLEKFAVIVDPDTLTVQLVPTGTARPSNPALEIPIRGSHAVIDARIGGKPVAIAIDMGSNGEIGLSTEAWARIDVTPTRTGVATGMGADGAEFQVQLVRVPEVRLGALTLTDVPIHIGPLPIRAADGILGMAVLTRYRIVMDIGAGTLWLVERGRAP